MDAQHTVGVAGGDLADIDARHIEAAAVRTVAALAAQIAGLLVLILKVAVTLRLDGQGLAIQGQLDVLLLEAGQVGLQLIAVAHIADIGLELRQRVVAKERAVDVLEITERIITTIHKKCHKSYLLFKRRIRVGHV